MVKKGAKTKHQKFYFELQKNQKLQRRSKRLCKQHVRYWNRNDEKKDRKRKERKNEKKKKMWKDKGIWKSNDIKIGWQVLERQRRNLEMRNKERENEREIRFKKGNKIGSLSEEREKEHEKKKIRKQMHSQSENV